MQNGNSSSDVESRLLSGAVDQQKVRCLALLHDEATQLPVGTQAWLASRQVRSHYHMRLGRQADFQRVSRLLTGRGIGLVLSGGGARALAHIGVIRALEETGVPIDAVGAVSGGAIVAGLWAAGLSPAGIVEKSIEAVDRVDYTLPLHALTTGHNWTNSMKRLFGSIMIEDLWRPFFCISTNLSQAGLLVHASGSLMHAVRASTAIPGILPPVFHAGDVLVDGGLINNLPTDLMKAHPDIGRVIAVDVGTADAQRMVEPFDYGISGWKSLWSRLRPWSRKPAVPTISETLLRSFSIANSQSAQVTKRLVDLYLEPPVKAYGLLEFDQVKPLAEVGYQYARVALASMDGDTSVR